MSADSFDGFAYERAAEHTSQDARRHYWAVAIGLQAVDGLEVSPYVRELSSSYVAGALSLEQTGELLRAYHAGEADPAHAESDLVSQRIAELLERGAFALAPDMLKLIHAYLFQDLDAGVYHPGEFKPERMVKQEEILNGDSVLYADPLAYDMSLQAAMNAELAKSYGALDSDELAGFCHSMAFLWQVHPFHEGNTRTVAVFSELYLNHLGFQVTNEPFELHACYFRDALVRAMYRNAAAGIFPDESYLVAFYENVLGHAHHALDREQLVCPQLFDHPEFLRNIDPCEALTRKPSAAVEWE